MRDATTTSRLLVLLAIIAAMAALGYIALPDPHQADAENEPSCVSCSLLG